MRFTKLILAFAGIILTGCASTPQPPPPAATSRAIGVIKGIDLATDTGDVLGELKGFPIEFVARYYRDPASRWPALTAAEVQRLSALGLKIVTVWEWHSGDPAYFTYATGYNDAQSAVRQAKMVGQPPGSAIYFAVDFNARDASLAAVDQYFRGVNAGLAAAGGGRPEYRVGVYGSGAVCASVRQAGLAQYTWLSGSTAWDGTAGYSGWNIKQAAAGARFPNLSFDHDTNEARDDYGGFQLGIYPTNPAGAVVAVAAVAPVAAGTVVNSVITAVVPPATNEPPPAPPAPEVASPPPTPARTAPSAPVVASAAPPSPLPAPTPLAPIPPVPAPPAPKPPVPAPAPGSAAAELAAAAAAEPPATESRAAPAQDQTTAHTAKGLTGSAQKTLAVAADNRALALPARHSGGSVAVEHKTSAPRRPKDHAPLRTTKVANVVSLDRSARHSADEKRSERRHHEEKD